MLLFLHSSQARSHVLSPRAKLARHSNAERGQKERKEKAFFFLKLALSFLQIRLGFCETLGENKCVLLAGFSVLLLLSSSSKAHAHFN